MASLSESRTEFLAADALGSSPSSIKYSRKGGVFVNTKKAIFLFLLVVACMTVVGLIVHFVEKDTRWMSKKEITEEATAKIPGNSEASTGDYAKLRLPRHVIPTYYRMQLQPFLQNDDGGENFTFKGHISITVICHNSTNTIVLHSKDLELDQQVNITLAADVTSTPTETVTSNAATVTPSLPASTMSSVTSSSSNSETTPTIPTMSDTPATVVEQENSTSTAGRRRKRRSPFRHRGDRRRSVDPVTTSATTASDEAPRVTGLSMDTASSMVMLNLDRSLVVGSTYVLNISFSGKLQDSLYGFYRSSYKDASGATRWMAVTHFEPQSARQAFPCFDEPDMKAQFEISIAHKPGMSSISNMPRRSTTAGENGWVWDHYQASPIMSTYLVAYIVAPEDFTTTEMVASSQPDIRVFARKDLLPYAAYATDVAPRMVQFYNEYFNISYPLPQMLIAAIPDFSAGAMENWGLITFREARVLYDPKASTTKDKDNIAMTVAHEIAHQWFGNLVTMKWWNDLWLNEGFASYMEYLGANYVEPRWGMLDKIVLYDVHSAMTEDSLRSTHAVSTKADTPGQISEQFDKMSYSKGASLIRMLNHTLTESVFRAGIADYLNHWQYKNAAQDDLWDALTEACRRNPQVNSLPSNLTVKDVMDTWTLQKGYPVVTVKRDYVTGAALLTQMRFTLDNSTNADEPESLWKIPVSYLTQEEMDAGNLSTTPRFWLTNTTGIIEGLPQDQWVVFNVYHTGYYRVNYDDRNWQMLSEYLVKAPILLPAATRAQLLDDAFNLAKAGLLGYEKALNVTRYLVTRENHYVPWNTVLRNLGYINRQLRRNKVYGEFQTYVRTILSNVNKSLGYEPKLNEDQMQKLLRTDVLSWLSRMGDKPTITWANNLFHDWMASPDPDNNSIPVDFRLTVYSTAIREGGAEEWDFALKRYIGAVSTPSEAIVLLKALGCTRREWLIDRLLDMIVSESTIRQQDTVWALRSIAGNPAASQLGYSFLINNWDRIYEKFHKTPSLLRTFLRSLIQGLTSEYDLKNLREFQKQNQDKLSYAERAMNQLTERLELQIHWFNSHHATVAEWLKSFNSNKI